jgi:hypothetical protein
MDVSYSFGDCISLMLKTKSRTVENPCKLLIPCMLAERMGFEPAYKRQTKDLTEHGQQI